VIGGGIIGLEMACVYAALGSKVTVVELAGQLMPGADPDLVKPLQIRIAKRYENIYLETRVNGVDIADDALVARFEGPSAPASAYFDRVLVAVGRIPNGKLVGAEAAGVLVSDQGFFAVDQQMRSNVKYIFAIATWQVCHAGAQASHWVKSQRGTAGEEFFGCEVASVATLKGAGLTNGMRAGAACEVSRFWAIVAGPWASTAEGFTKLLFDSRPETG
jgi:dihydrolipoamide dehydrogenase